MGRIVTSVEVRNLATGCAKRLDALVDTGASHLTLPLAWKEQLGAFEGEEQVQMRIATQDVVDASVCGPALIKVEGFRAVYSEVLFVDMAPVDGEYEPLVGYIPLEQCGAAVDLLGHRLLPVGYLDLKALKPRGCCDCQRQWSSHMRLRP